MKPLMQFVATLWQPEDLIEVRALPTIRGGFPQCESIFVVAEDLIDIEAKLTKMNEGGHNLFAGVLPRRNSGATKDIDCLEGRILWADFDGITHEEALKTAAEKNIPAPTMVVNSGHGTHLYWKMTEKIPAYSAAKTVHDLAHLFGSDTSVANPSRIMRIPGFTNLKEPKAPVTIISVNDDAVYTYNKFCENVPAANYYGGVKMPENYGKDYKINRSRREITDRASSYVSAFTTCSEGGRNHAAFSLAACLRKDFALEEMEAWVIMQEWNNSKCSPPLTEHELYSCLVSGERYGKHSVGEKLTESKTERAERREARKDVIEVVSTQPDASLLERIKAEISQEISGRRQAIPMPWKSIKGLPLMAPGKVGVITGLPGSCKSYFALNLGRSCQKYRKPWKYIPLEDPQEYHARRLVAVACGEWRMAGNFDTVSNRRLDGVLTEIMDEHKTLIEEWGPAVLPNPAFIPGGKMQAVEHLDALELIEDLAKTNRVIMLDPIAQIEFVGKNEWQVQAQFMRELIGIANNSEATIILVIHRSKKDNAGVYGVEGSKRFVDLAHTVISIDRHKGDMVAQMEGEEEQDVEANRIITIEKCRDSVLEGGEFAFNFGDCGPTFKEFGKVVQRNKKNS